MDKKGLMVLLCAVTACFCGFSQKNYDYEPMTKSQKAEIDNIMLANNVSSFLINDRISLGYVNLTNIRNIVSYNPIEGTRIRLSAETNAKTFSAVKPLKNRLALSAMVAYGTEDNKLKYSFGGAFNFAKKPKGVYTFPCSTLSINYENNTYMPSSPNYDVAYFSFGNGDRFYFARKRQLTMSFLQEFPSCFALRPYVYRQQIDSYLLYGKGTVTELLNSEFDYINKAAGIEVSYTPTRKISSVFNILNSRFYSLQTQFSVNYSYNIQDYIVNNEYSRLEADVQHRFTFLPMALDVKLTGGKIFGESDHYMYFTPNYRVNSVSNTFGFNLYSPYEVTFREYVQTYVQLNLGGVLLDNISFFKQFRPNEFINFKALFAENEDPYCEAGAGIDHIFGFLGFEVVKRLAKDNPFNMPEWAIKVRCNL